jgi:hypothetical protein
MGKKKLVIKLQNKGSVITSFYIPTELPPRLVHAMRMLLIIQTSKNRR